MTATGQDAIILNLLLARAATMVIGTPPLPIAYPEKTFTVPDDKKYLEVSHLPNKPFWEGVASIGPAVLQGLFQVTVHWPSNDGIINPMNIVSAVCDYFKKGTTLYSPGLQIKLNRKPWNSSPLSDANGVSIVVTIPYRATVSS